MSTDLDATPLDRGQRWRLHPRVALRPEPFGALAYHYDNRRLNFLRSPDLVRLVRSLADHPDPRRAFEAQGLDPRRWPAFARALRSLARSDFVEPVPPPEVARSEVPPPEVPPPEVARSEVAR